MIGELDEMVRKSEESVTDNVEKFLKGMFFNNQSQTFAVAVEGMKVTQLRNQQKKSLLEDWTIKTTIFFTSTLQPSN